MTVGAYNVVAGDAETLRRALPIEPGAVRSRRIFAGPGARVVCLSIDGGQVMKEHTATVPVLLQVLDGHAAVEVGDERIDLPAGALLHIDANRQHAIEALEPTHLLLILCERLPAALSSLTFPKPRAEPISRAGRRS